jgi:hypothetical protein
MIIKTKYRVYHSRQYNQPKGVGITRFIFRPERPFKPLGLIIFGPGNALVDRLIIGNCDQLVVPTPANVFTPRGFTIEELELLCTSSTMSAVLEERGIFTMAMFTVNIGTHLNIDLTEPVDTVLFWGIEQDYSTE